MNEFSERRKLLPSVKVVVVPRVLDLDVSHFVKTSVRVGGGGEYRDCVIDDIILTISNNLSSI